MKVIIPEFLAFWLLCIEEATPVSRRGKTITEFPWLISLFVNIGTIEYKIYPDSSLKVLWSTFFFLHQSDSWNSKGYLSLAGAITSPWCWPAGRQLLPSTSEMTANQLLVKGPHMRALQLHVEFLKNRILICWAGVIIQAWPTYTNQLGNETEIEFSFFLLSDWLKPFY